VAKVAKVTSRTPSNEASKPTRTLSITAEDPVIVGRRSPSPARRPPSNVVHVTGLVRPYTLGQLKELLGRTGKLVDDGFWIDSIKSHCYVVVSAEHSLSYSVVENLSRAFKIHFPNVLCCCFSIFERRSKSHGHHRKLLLYSSVTVTIFL